MKRFYINHQELLRPELYCSEPDLVGKSLPTLSPVSEESILPIKLMPFNEAYSYKDYSCTVHFYIHDTLFLRVFRRPEKYLDFFRKCHSVIAPDLSQYAEMPASERYLSAYLNRSFARYLQDHGVTVIPNVTWSLPDSYAYSFSGLPHNAPVAINCKGVLKHDLSKYLWLKGYKEACTTLTPSVIIRYGTRMPGENAGISIYFVNERLKRLKDGC